MARQLGGINGPFIGKVGSVIGYSRNGNFFMKRLKKERKKPAVGDEALNQTKFANAQRWLRPLLATVRVGFHSADKKGQAFIAAKSHLLNNAMRLENGKFFIDPALAKVSVGDLPLPENIQCEVQPGQSLRISWEPSNNTGNDQILIAAYNIGEYNVKKGDPGEALQQAYGAPRNSGQETFFVGNKIGKPLHVWVAFISADRTRRSDSIYLGVYSDPVVSA